MWHKDATRLGHYCIAFLRSCSSLLSLSLFLFFSRLYTLGRSLARSCDAYLICNRDDRMERVVCARTLHFRRKVRSIPSRREICARNVSLGPSLTNHPYLRYYDIGFQGTAMAKYFNVYEHEVRLRKPTNYNCK